jgi:hypothetical protein
MEFDHDGVRGGCMRTTALSGAIALVTALPSALRAQSSPLRTSSAQQEQSAPPCAEVTALPIDSAAASQLRPDVVIRASATARAVTVNGQPRVNVTFNGCGIRDTVRVLERTNLPKPVVSGTTYQNVRIAVELYAWFDVECILAQLTAPADSAGRTTARTCRRQQ